MMPQRKPRIGVVLTVGKVEAKKEELISFRRKVPSRPWAALAPERFHIDRKETKWRSRTVGVPADVAIGQYIQSKYGGTFDVDYISPEEITSERLKSNDINFLIIYDLLEAFHTDKSKLIFNTLREVLHKADNIFPNLEFQEFVYSKLLYYNHFHQRGLPIAPTITISKEEWAKQVAKKGRWVTVADEVLQEIRRKGLKWFIAKPVYGQEAKGVMVFETDNMQKDQFRQHLRTLIEKYPGIIIQEYIKDFGDEDASPELRMYFVGREYQYTCIGMPGKRMYTLKEDGANKARPMGKRGGFFSLPPSVDFQVMKKIAMKAIENMPNISLKRGSKNIALPSLLTRVDMGCLREGVFDPWINEVEFVPSLYIEDHDWPIDARMGDQMVRIAKQYLRLPAGRRRPAGAARRRVGTKTNVKVNVGKIKRVLSVRFSAKGKRETKGKLGGASRHVIKRGKRS